MTQITLELPDELAERLRPVQDDLPRVLELGLRAIDAAAQSEFTGASAVLEFLAGLPSAEEILALRPAPALSERIHALLEKSRNEGLSADEQTEWRQYEYLEHLVRLAKARAAAKLKSR